MCKMMKYFFDISGTCSNSYLIFLNRIVRYPRKIFWNNFSSVIQNRKLFGDAVEHTNKQFHAHVCLFCDIGKSFPEFQVTSLVTRTKQY